MPSKADIVLKPEHILPKMEFPEVFLLSICLSYISIAVIYTMAKKTYKRKHLFGSLQFKRVIVRNCHGGGMAAGRQAGSHGPGAVAESSHLET